MISCPLVSVSWSNAIHDISRLFRGEDSHENRILFHTVPFSPLSRGADKKNPLLCANVLFAGFQINASCFAVQPNCTPLFHNISSNTNFSPPTLNVFHFPSEKRNTAISQVCMCIMWHTYVTKFIFFYHRHSTFQLQKLYMLYHWYIF